MNTWWWTVKRKWKIINARWKIMNGTDYYYGKKEDGLLLLQTNDRL